MKPNTNPITASLLLLSACGLIASSAPARGAATTESQAYTFKMDSRASLLRVGAAPMEVTADALEGAEMVLEAIEKKDVARAEAAIKFYDTIIPKENLGGDYTAMQWLLRDLIATV